MTINRDATGPSTLLGGYLAGFGAWMEEHGYAASTVKQYSLIADRFNTYLTNQNSTNVTGLNEGHIDGYLEDVEPRRPNGRKAVVTEYYRQACRRLLKYLRGTGVVVPAEQKIPVPPILTEYLSFLSNHRALAVETIAEHERWLLRFLGHLGFTGEADQLREISLSRIDGFLIEATRGFKRTSVGHVCAAVRGFLRYLYMRGVLSTDLREHVATPRIYSLEGIPRAIEWGEVQRVLAAVDRNGLSGRRDYAIMVVLAYYGLRAAEVAVLRVDDLDWRHDTIRVGRRKSNTVDAVPMVPIVGSALVEYLRDRPVSSHPEVFLKLIAPAGPMSRAGIGWVARKHLLATGVKAAHLGAHTLRHSFAVQLLRKGFPLKTIGDALGHSSPQSTFIYTKAPTEDLRSVALEVTEVLK
ncbi:MAG: hypothetical protein CL911_05020 [Deltaproteobacteria bacterium]|nr:hypothetical protein [Deltaproteobacteria bacterium]